MGLQKVIRDSSTSWGLGCPGLGPMVRVLLARDSALESVSRFRLFFGLRLPGLMLRVLNVLGVSRLGVPIAWLLYLLSFLVG